MAHALQVSFRRITPKESLVSLAAEHYRVMRLVNPSSAECLVSLEASEDPRPVTQASVRVANAAGSAESVVKHRNARIALELALIDVRQQLRAARSQAPRVDAAG